MQWLQFVGRSGVVLLLVHQQETRESRDFGEMFLDVSAVYSITHSMAMEQTGLLDVENPIHMFTLQHVLFTKDKQCLI